MCCSSARQHIPHTTNFDKLVGLVVFCGDEDLKKFLDRAGRNAVYTSHVVLVEFIEALRIWVEESLLKRLRQASYFSIMAVSVHMLRLLRRCHCSVDGRKMGYQRNIFGNNSSEKS